MKNNDFNGIARYYTFLSSVVFGSAITRSQVYFLNSVPAHCTVLLIGDGTGTSLYYLLKFMSCSKIIYVEPSSEMTRLARKKIKDLMYTTEVIFLEKTIEESKITPDVNVIVTPFLFDLFPEEKSGSLIKELSSLLTEDGTWIFTDFKINQNSIHRFWQLPLLKIMYLFFRGVSNIEAGRLPDFERCFSKAGLKRKQQALFYLGMMESSVYEK